LAWREEKMFQQAHSFKEMCLEGDVRVGTLAIIQGGAEAIT